MLKNQKGFSAVEALLIAIIIGAVGFVGWYVWRARQVADDTPVATVQQSDSGNASTEEYVDKKFGFAFTVPEDLSSPEPDFKPYNTNDITKTIAGNSYNIPIGVKFSGGFVTKDWQGKRAQVQGFTVYPACKDASAENIVIIYETEDVCVAVFGYSSPMDSNGYGGDTANLIVQKKFTKNADIAGLEFSQQPVSVDDFSDKSLKETANFYEWQDSIVEFAKSIREL